MKTKMNLKTIVGLTLAVVLTAGLAMAGRGGGGGGHAAGGGGGNHGGGGGGGGVSHASPAASRPAPTHTPSFSTPRQTVNTPRQTFNTPHPATTPASRPSLPQNAGGNRPGMTAGSRPGVTPGSRPGIDQRPGIANTPSWDNRNAGNRPNFDNRARPGDRAYVANRANFGNNFNINRTNDLVRPTHNNWNHGDWYHGDWHGNWDNSWYHRPIGWWGAGGWAGDLVASIPWSWGYWPYYNPYYGVPLASSASFDYSQPIVVAQTAVSPPDIQTGLTAEEQATPLLDGARNAFLQGDYTTALAQIDQAIAQVPNDTVLHEFRGLVLFALGRYKEAAATDYAVLSAGPGWDWTTLIALYPNVEVYTAQLRALEQYAQLHPAASEAKFLLAENYLTCGYTDAAAAQLKQVVQLNPKDQLSAQLLSSISAPNAVQPATSSGPAAPAAPATASSLVGNWTATRADSAAIALALAGDGKFTWKVDHNGKPQQFSGTYTVVDNLLVLKQGDNPMLVGQVAALANNRFTFKLAGDNPSDPGLTFTR